MDHAGGDYPTLWTVRVSAVGAFALGGGLLEPCVSVVTDQSDTSRFVLYTTRRSCRSHGIIARTFLIHWLYVECQGAAHLLSEFRNPSGVTMEVSPQVTVRVTSLVYEDSFSVVVSAVSGTFVPRFQTHHTSLNRGR